MKTVTRDDVLEREIPYRLDSVSVLNIATRLLLKWRKQKPMQVFFDETLVINGTSAAFFNPVIEAGLVHCRALLEFVGLKALSSNPLRLAPRRTKREDDYGIEDFVGPAGPLSLVTPSQAIARYRGAASDAEAALAIVLSGTNKMLAHLTHGIALPRDRVRLIEIASRGVRAIVVSHVYTPLGLPEPKSTVSSRARNAA